MDAKELQSLIDKGEISFVQFKSNIHSEISLSQEIVAFSNSNGGKILIGIDDKSWQPIGLEKEDLKRLANLIVNASNEHVKSPVFVQTEVVEIEKKYILVLTIPEGKDKPYKDKDGIIYLKNRANKRKVTSNEELARLLQAGHYFSADEMLIPETTIADLSRTRFEDYFMKEFKSSFEHIGLSYHEALIAKRVIKNDRMTLAGILFFGKDVQSIKPSLTIKCVSFLGNEIGSNNYRNKPDDFKGTIPELYDKAMSFLLSNLFFMQKEVSFNSKGVLEISQVALEELLQNALVHRDYLKNAPIRIMIFDNRIEIISPGSLPNSLTVNDIKYGNAVIRNHQIASLAYHTLPYAGLGSGIKRALAAQPDIDFYNDIPGEQFIVTIPRPDK